MGVGPAVPTTAPTEFRALDLLFVDEVDDQLSMLTHATGGTTLLQDWDDDVGHSVYDTIRAEVDMASRRTGIDPFVVEPAGQQQAALVARSEHEHEQEHDESSIDASSLSSVLEADDMASVAASPEREHLVHSRSMCAQGASQLAAASTVFAQWEAVQHFERAQRERNLYEEHKRSQFHELRDHMHDLRVDVRSEIDHMVSDSGMRLHRLNIARPGLAAMDTVFTLDPLTKQSTVQASPRPLRSKSMHIHVSEDERRRTMYRSKHDLEPVCDTWCKEEDRFWQAENQARTELIAMARAYSRQDSSGRMAARYNSSSSTAGSSAPKLPQSNASQPQLPPAPLRTTMTMTNTGEISSTALDDNLFNWEGEFIRILRDDAAYVQMETEMSRIRLEGKIKELQETIRLNNAPEAPSTLRTSKLVAVPQRASVDKPSNTRSRSVVSVPGRHVGVSNAAQSTSALSHTTAVPRTSTAATTTRLSTMPSKRITSASTPTMQPRQTNATKAAALAPLPPKPSVASDSDESDDDAQYFSGSDDDDDDAKVIDKQEQETAGSSDCSTRNVTNTHELNQ